MAYSAYPPEEVDLDSKFNIKYRFILPFSTFGKSVLYATLLFAPVLQKFGHQFIDLVSYHFRWGVEN